MDTAKIEFINRYILFNLPIVARICNKQNQFFFWRILEKSVKANTIIQINNKIET